MVCLCDTLLDLPSPLSFCKRFPPFVSDRPRIHDTSAAFASREHHQASGFGFRSLDRVLEIVLRKHQCPTR